MGTPLHKKKHQSTTRTTRKLNDDDHQFSHQNKARKTPIKHERNHSKLESKSVKANKKTLHHLRASPLNKNQIHHGEQ